MKKLIIAILIGAAAGLLYAASQPIANGPSVLTTAVIRTVSPNYSGQMVVCSNCSSVNGGLGTVCISTGTTVGAWIIAGSSLAATTACL